MRKAKLCDKTDGPAAQKEGPICARSTSRELKTDLDLMRFTALLIDDVLAGTVAVEKANVIARSVTNMIRVSELRRKLGVSPGKVEFSS